MKAARVNHTATLLPDGQVIVTGGWNGTDGNLDSSELYNPLSGNFHSELRLSGKTGRRCF
ncbi:Kelch repeat-containing protein [candidate division CSSED10-310 bacterium]|uniref:Kelch repeat-containing protein n=1 Tax=candidate division CSSED10-310 bacterium TaxID=2855610 RepID=A0ABV6Z021_UNCC1